jgi:uncharacterized protein (DUF1800 family)
MNPSPFNRRRFIRVAGAGATAACLGCDAKMRKVFLGPMGDRIDAVRLAPFSNPAGDDVDLISHVLSRLTWGVAPGDYACTASLGRTAEEAVDHFIEASLAGDSAQLARNSGELTRRLQGFSRGESILDEAGELYDYHPKELGFDLTRAALLRAVHSPDQLYEVMVAFWTDHFNIDSSKADCRWLKPLDDREVIRRHAFGRFSELLAASATSPAMLFYLDGRDNTNQGKPNENYARELMELHTMGVHGGYTQTDVLEAARCLTGWTVIGRDSKRLGIGKVEFIADRHDDGPKRVLGQTIAAGGMANDLTQLLEIVTNHPATPRFIAAKLCRRFISDEPPENAVTATAAAFASSKGDIRKTLRALFATDEFRTVRRTKFKRPFHFLVSALRATGVPHQCGKEVQIALRRMGHMPFDYPTPEGYSEQGDDWLSTLLARWDFALRLGRGQIGVTTWQAATLLQAAGGEAGLAAHLLGRKPTPDETRSLAAVAATDRLAMLLAMPGFQQY